MLRPLGDRVIAKTLDMAEKTAGGIYLPDTAKEKPVEAKVIAVGEGVRLADGTVVPIDVKVGDKIVYGKYAGTEVKVDGEEFVILRAEDIFGVID
ncbi:MAG: co-chaperone GroES [Abditibacteriota bacterium]|nr:co-chaperone GroES [Abditibacteriota bacterium]